MRPLYICDIDGTVADLKHRLHFIKKEKPDWDSFHDYVESDSPIMPVIRTIRVLAKNADIWFFTGRMESCREHTENWLKTHVLYRNNIVEMRRGGDYRPDTVVKQEMLDNMFAVDRERLVGVFDDRNGVVNMWRKNGVTCFQVKDGDY